ncbi:MAG: hypothetical protein J6U72_00610, partial [Clostridia bacterium]|nr:hypothetical protein [Clostridia bacterium]
VKPVNPDFPGIAPNNLNLTRFRPSRRTFVLGEDLALILIFAIFPAFSEFSTAALEKRGPRAYNIHKK